MKAGLMLIGFLFCLQGYPAEAVDYAHCHIEGPSGEVGHVCFKKENNETFVHGFVENLTLCSDLRMHVHQDKPESNNCEGIGGHYDVDTSRDNVDEGNLGSHSSYSDGVMIFSDLKLNAKLSIDGNNAILGRAIAIHHGGVTLCCEIKACSQRMYNKMMGKMSSYSEPNQKCA